MSDMLEKIDQRRKVLYAAGEKLKERFYGISEQIDQLVYNIEAWYCMPELLTRPTIVCLWGLTGVGKTDLIRQLIHELEVADSYVEIQMTTKGSATHWEKTLQAVIYGSNITEDRPGILLLDEMQRFRSKDGQGELLDEYAFQDVWMLLSDGSFGGASNRREAYMEALMEDAFNTDMADAKEKATAGASNKSDDDDEDEKPAKAAATPTDIEKHRRFKRSYWSARQLKFQFRLTEEVNEIMTWDTAKKMEILKAKMNDRSLYQPLSYPKLLVFIAGNLDEAYNMAEETGEVDHDADIFHKFSKKIDVLKIKQALLKRFTPEQIARFGNTHVIYPALCRGTYERIIREKLMKVVDACAEKTGVRFDLDISVNEAIYRNGVFPAQGTRPVFSTISSFFECSLPQFVYRCYSQGLTEATLFYDQQTSEMYVNLPNGRFAVKNEGAIDKIKKKKRNPDMIRRVAVHEAGHALAYAKLFGYAPTQIAVNPASAQTNGFIGVHEIDQSRTSLLSHVQVLMAGRAAESIVFGDGLISGGASGDIIMATSVASNMIRSYGMYGYSTKIMPSNAHGAHAANTNMLATNEQVDGVVKTALEEVTTLLQNNLDLFREITDYLITEMKMDASVLIEMCGKYGIAVQTLDAEERVMPKFGESYDKYWASRKAAETA